MFTGIIEEKGRIVSVDEKADLLMWDGRHAPGFVLVISSSVCVDGAYLGCSIAVNGVCLTVTEFTASTFSVNCAPETLRLTNLRKLRAGDPVNLERSVKVSDRNSGHFVQGHVDDTGVIKEFNPDGDSLYVKIQPPAELLKYIVPKGYIAIDGTSLTVCEVNRDKGWFTVMLISFTQKKIILPLKKVGDLVNLEVDVMSKYMESSLSVINDEVSRLKQRQNLLLVACSSSVILSIAVLVSLVRSKKL